MPKKESLRLNHNKHGKQSIIRQNKTLKKYTKKLILPKDSLTGKYALTTNMGVPTT